jgi:AcrR family transcriptional regulator
MSIIVEHEKRKHEILEKALDVFVSSGYADTTYAKIADKCGITRTILYTYFRNKQDVFQYCIKQLMGEVETEILPITKSDISNAQKLKLFLNTIIARLEDNKRLLLILSDYLVHIAKEGKDPDYRVRKRTIRLRHFLTSIIIDGISAGEFKKIPVRASGSMFYSMLEVAIFRLTILRKNTVDLSDSIELAVNELCV